MKSLLIKIKNILFGFVAVVLSGCAVKIPSLPESLDMEMASQWNVTDYQLLSRKIFSVDKNIGMQKYIVEVLGNNPDLKSIAATAKVARLNIDILAGEGRPRANLNLASTRSKDIVAGGIGNSVSVGVDVSWSMDIWGKLSDDTAAAEYLAEKAQYEFNQTKRVLVGQSAYAWIDYWSYIRAEKNLKNLKSAYTSLRIFYEEAYQEGLSPYVFYLDAKKQEKHSQTRLQEMQFEALKTLQHMNTLRGQMPADELVISDDKVPLSLVSLTNNIPATALANRPDIQASFAEVLALGRSARAAHKALLPQINLTGSADKGGDNLKKAFSGELVWQLIGGLTQPLFNGGQLKSIATQKSAEAESSWWQYQRIVLNAMLEVENAMANDQMLVRQIQQQQALLVDLEQKILSAEERFSDGELSLFDYLQIKVERIEDQIEMDDYLVKYIKNRVALVMALGLPLKDLGNNSNEI